MDEKIFSVSYGGKDLIIKTGKLAKQTAGSCTVQYGDTVVLVTACISKSPTESDFFPLLVDYQEKTYAAGKIPGGFFKREGRSSEKEILTSRLIDRPIRPLFPEQLRNEVQVVAMVISHDIENNPDILAMIGASTVLSISEIPFKGPIGVIRLGRIAGEFVINPTYKQLEESDIDVVVATDETGVIMIESSAREMSEDIMLFALSFAQKHAGIVIDLQKDMIKKVGKTKINVEFKPMDEDFVKQVEGLAVAAITKANKISVKEERQEILDQMQKDVIKRFSDDVKEPKYTKAQIKELLDRIERDQVRSYIISQKKRIDGRSYDQIRNISCEVGVLPRAHGSGLFTRGQTQSLSIATLGTSTDKQLIDALEGETFKPFMLHYNFPAFSVGEIKPMRGPGRREIGHGALAEKSLAEVMPDKENFPYTVRVVSEILESNGSSSMATVCAGTLSLMDAGVPIKAPVAGIAMGLVKEKKDAAILTDIAGVEDHFGDMDFKVTGTKKGVTAIQLDIKLNEGLEIDLIKKILEDAKKARITILKKIEDVISCPRKDISQFAPRIVTFKINTEKIRDVIGPGGKVIKKIIEDTGVDINIEDDGTVMIASSDAKALDAAVEIVKGLTTEAEVGKIYKGTVKRIMNFGAFVEILPGKEGLCHVSEISDQYVEKVESVVKVGDEVKVKLVEIDSQGRLNLSIKKAVEKKDIPK